MYPPLNKKVAPDIHHVERDFFVCERKPERFANAPSANLQMQRCQALFERLSSSRLEDERTNADCLTESLMHLNVTNLSHLFTIRIWIEFVDCETDRLRIKVQHVLSGEVRYFQGWSSAVAFIAEQSVGQSEDLDKMEEG